MLSFIDNLHEVFLSFFYRCFHLSFKLETFLPFKDIDECKDNLTNTCDKVNGECINLEGDYRCECNSGWTGNGTYCTGEQ